MPVDHEYFKNTNDIQWAWYNLQDIEDYNEQMVNMRDAVEYNASFIAPDVVKSIVEERGDQLRGNMAIAGDESDAVFNESVRQMFGSTIGDQPTEEMHEVTDVIDRIKEYEEYQSMMKNTASPFNYRYWLDFDME